MVLTMSARQSFTSFRSTVGSRWPLAKTVARTSSGTPFQSRNFPGHRCQQRCMSTEGGDDLKNDDQKTPKDKKEKPKKESPNSKLNDLLISIVKDGAVRKAGEGPSRAKTSRESVRLAVPVKEEEKAERKKQRTKTAQWSPPEPKLGKRVLAAVKKVAAEMGGDATEIENELVKKLKSQSAAKVKINDLFEGMKVESERPAPKAETSERQSTESEEMEELETSRAARVRHLISREKPSRRFQPRFPREDDVGRPRRRFESDFADTVAYSRVDLFGGRPLGIFTAEAETPDQKAPELKTWDRLYKRELKLAVTHPPANGFEEMVLWTEQGKLWQFPIDNEQGMDEEAQYSFEDHVFLDNYIESWCPDKGPIRNFMELVCVGLSKNSYLTVKEKHEYLDWYHDYFKEKSAILKEVGAAGVKS